MLKKFIAVLSSQSTSCLIFKLPPRNRFQYMIYWPLLTCLFPFFFFFWESTCLFPKHWFANITNIIGVFYGKKKIIILKLVQTGKVIWIWFRLCYLVWLSRVLTQLVSAEVPSINPSDNKGLQNKRLNLHKKLLWMGRRNLLLNCSSVLNLLFPYKTECQECIGLVTTNIQYMYDYACKLAENS